ncbi:hypothetical protein J6590_095168 [Homalodisca vitripennis]|nr:hypothetical protein J6590_003530 [Homalodisca vitripennis]KAG8329090.1 hypothetical protein J6590_095168 [Homalodisca vitripennis]
MRVGFVSGSSLGCSEASDSGHGRSVNHPQTLLINVYREYKTCILGTKRIDIELLENPKRDSFETLVFTLLNIYENVRCNPATPLTKDSKVSPRRWGGGNPRTMPVEGRINCKGICLVITIRRVLEGSAYSA